MAAASPVHDGRYRMAARWLHALVAVLVVALLAVGLAMTRGSFDLATTFELYRWHKAVGIAVAALMVVRLLARWRQSPPPLPEAIGPVQKRAASLAHALLYALLLALPLSGWLMVSASPLAWPIELPGGTSVPLLAALANLPEPAKAVWFERLRAVHGVLAWALITLAGLHIMAALRHGRTVLRRMGLP